MPRWKRLFITLVRPLAYPRLWRFLLDWRTRYGMAWAVALSSAAFIMYVAWTAFDSNPDPAKPGHIRRDGNAGHTFIDFGGQYLMGRMLVRGEMRHLYDRKTQRRILAEVYPRSDEDPYDDQSDVDKLMWCFMSRDDPETEKAYASVGGVLATSHILNVATYAVAAQPVWVPDHFEGAVHDRRVGGPLYPPINAIYYAPLGMWPPHIAYRLMQIANLLLAFAAGLGISVLTRGRLWWPVVACLILFFPGFAGSIQLGQNATLTLTILVWGWALISHGRQIEGGAVWGLLAFKPVWALSFFLVPLLTLRWRVCLSMCAVGALLVVMTLPLVGTRGWHEWLNIGLIATETYKSDSNWIHMSRDLQGIPRRWLDFGDGKEDERRDDVPSKVIGYTLLALAFGTTVILASLRLQRRSETLGAGPAFLFLGAWLCCFHFMYYDVLLTVLPICALCAEPRRFLQPRTLVINPQANPQLGERRLDYYRPRFLGALAPESTWFQAGRGMIWVWNSPSLTLIALLLMTEYILPGMGFSLLFPWDTLCLIGLWFWCGILWMREPASAPKMEPPFESEHALLGSPHFAAELPQLSAGVGGAH